MNKNLPKIWLTADTHFGHKRLIEFGRPENFEEKILKGLEIVGEKDVLIHLGDFCIGNDEKHHKEFMERVKGLKIFVRGNHDNKTDSFYYRMGWNFVCHAFVGKYFGERFYFTHVPAVPSESWKYNVHGHTHGNLHRDTEVLREFYTKERHIEIALENTDYQPVLLTQKILRKKYLKSIDNVN